MYLTQRPQWSNPTCSRSLVNSNLFQPHQAQSVTVIKVSEFNKKCIFNTNHFNQHFCDEVNIDYIINDLKRLIQCRHKHLWRSITNLQHFALLVANACVLAGLVHAQSDAVDEDHRHGGPLEPAEHCDVTINNSSNAIMRGLLTGSVRFWCIAVWWDAPGGNIWMTLAWTEARIFQYPSLQQVTSKDSNRKYLIENWRKV